MPKPKTPEHLNKYKRVVDEYFSNGFDKVAAVRVVFQQPDVSYRSAHQRFSDYLKHTEVKEYLAQKHEEARKIASIGHENIMMRLLEWANSDYTAAMTMSEEEIKEKLPPSLRKLISGWKVVETQFDGGEKKSFEIFWMNKEKAIEMINKHVGFYSKENANEPIEVIVTDNRKPQ